MLSASDREWLTENEGGIADYELRELPHEPVFVLAALEEVAADLGLRGHAAGGRGRWGIIESQPYMHATVRVAAAHPGTAVSVRVDTAKAERVDVAWGGWIVGGGAFIVGLALDPLTAIGMIVVGGLFLERRAERARLRREEALHARGLAWRRRFWEQVAGRLATRTSFRSPGA